MAKTYYIDFKCLSRFLDCILYNFETVKAGTFQLPVAAKLWQNHHLALSPFMKQGPSAGRCLPHRHVILTSQSQAS
jgi:hypothetical protein